LRGCIGTFAEQALHKGLYSYALQSALHDKRFNKVELAELPLLKCSVSLLVDFEKAANCFDWDIGTHGIRISFDHPTTGEDLGATYLPDVCAEQGWTKQECLNSLFKKAGYKGPVTKELLHNTELVRYKSSKYSLSYEEYKKMSSSSVASKK